MSKPTTRPSPKEARGFTPGPWRVGETSRHSDDMWDECAIRTETPGYVVAFVPVPDDAGRANAALIASAPALLAENERLRGALEGLVAAIKRDGDFVEDSREYDDARASERERFGVGSQERK